MDAIAVAAHPGYAATNLQTAGPQMENSGFGERLMLLANRVLAQSAADGALPMLRAATGADVTGADYFGPDGFQELHGSPKKVDCTARARNADDAARLWTLSEELTGVSYLD